MSFLVKKANYSQRQGVDLVRSWRHIARATATVPASTTEEIFTIVGGRVLVHLLIGEVTTVIQTQADNLSVIVNPTTGTSGTIATTLDITADEVGTQYLVEGDGTALVGVTAGGSFFAVGTPVPFIAPIGGIDILTSATNTGAIKWDIWYEPLDDNADIIAS